MLDNTRVYPDLVRHLLRETQSMPDNARVYPDLVRHLWAARDFENAAAGTQLAQAAHGGPLPRTATDSRTYGSSDVVVRTTAKSSRRDVSACSRNFKRAAGSA